MRQQYAEQAQRCTPRFLYRALKLCNDCDMAYRAAPNKRLLVELTLIQVAQILQEDEAAGSGRRPKKCLLPIFQLAPTTAVGAAPQRQAQPSAAPQVASAMPSGHSAVSPTASPVLPAGCCRSPHCLPPFCSDCRCKWQRRCKSSGQCSKSIRPKSYDNGVTHASSTA